MTNAQTDPLAKIVRETLAMNAHNDDEGHLRCTCDDCIADLAVELEKRAFPPVTIFTPGMNATTMPGPSKP